MREKDNVNGWEREREVKCNERKIVKLKIQVIRYYIKES